MKKTPVARDIMKTGLVTVGPEDSILAAAQKLVKHHLSGAPVVDREHRLLGVVSERDCLLPLVDSAFETDPVPPVSARMAKDLRTIGPETDVMAIAEEFAQHPVRRLLVVEDGKLLGLVSRGDLLKAVVEWIDPDEQGRPAPRNYWSRIRDAKESPLA
jgi:CBS domain-containing protein